MKIFTPEQTSEQLGWEVFMTECYTSDGETLRSGYYDVGEELKTVTFVLYDNSAIGTYYNNDKIAVPDGEVWSGVSVKSVYKMDVDTFIKMKKDVVNLRKHILKSLQSAF